jgi:hypothetical protein
MTIFRYSESCTPHTTSHLVVILFEPVNKRVQGSRVPRFLTYEVHIFGQERLYSGKLEIMSSQFLQDGLIGRNHYPVMT